MNMNIRTDIREYEYEYEYEYSSHTGSLVFKMLHFLCTTYSVPITIYYIRFII